jgi:hypothetical protein
MKSEHTKENVAAIAAEEFRRPGGLAQIISNLILNQELKKKCQARKLNANTNRIHSDTDTNVASTRSVFVLFIFLDYIFKDFVDQVHLKAIWDQSYLKIDIIISLVLRIIPAGKTSYLEFKK